MIRFIKEGLTENKEKLGALLEIQPRTELNLVKQMCTLMDILIEDTKYMETFDDELMHRIFVFSCAWGLGSCLEFNERKRFGDKLKTIIDNEDLQGGSPGNKSI